MVIRHKVSLASVAILLVAGAVAFLSIDNNPSNNTRSIQAEGASSETPAPSARLGLADSSDKVRVNIVRDKKALVGDTDEIILTLDIEPGWHVNANPASMEFLVPTVASSSVNGQSLEIPVQYPRGRISDITLGDTTLEVYDDDASIRLLPDEEHRAMLKEAGKLDITLRMQACSDEGVCLAPANLYLNLNDIDTKSANL
ncbi:MAG: hypothetical protein COB25_010310 [Oceanospirillales bacterium]|jgi:hypothetical protein|uniref:protein-disulfide reductase DsbD domain-containing protein n=1 Tax=Marinobacter sp. 1-3A TaxID=2582920 RepID=UPI000BDB0B7C|nr:protein-disulfide reductase DsbD domain-containing protein [Marinobacter sp. 1-3A]MBK1872624.1 hypothetical protein [Marinobacter sp. 1-3A]MBL1272831.1 hypothetical protein [Oceanospirillales bacterium]